MSDILTFGAWLKRRHHISPATHQAYQRLGDVGAPLAQRYLPAQLTAFIGREIELVQLVHLLADPTRILAAAHAGAG